LPRWAVLLGVIVIAQIVVFGLGAPALLRGFVRLSAFTGGVALAFSLPFLLVLVPYLTILFGNLKKDGPTSSRRWISWGPLGWYLGAFALAFVVTISGFPGAIATQIQRSEWLVNSGGGVIFLVWGLLVLLGLLPLGPDRHPPSVWRTVAGSGSAGVLGAATGAAFYHALDPVYDSVFFLTANAVAASHAPLTVAVFAAGLGLTYLATGILITAEMASQARWARGILLAGRMLPGIAVALIGLAILTQRFGTIRGLLF
jgi:cytochrome c-type biogenesis protein